MHLFLAGHAGGLANLLGAAPGQARDPEGLGA
jgi:hypothetical protein